MAYTPGPWTVREWAKSTAVFGPDGECPLVTFIKPKSYYTDYPVTRVDADGTEWKTLSTKAAERAGNYVATPEHQASIDALEIANAHLIAAAPDLYAALGAIMSAHGPGTMPHEMYFAANAALAKAEGREIEPFDPEDDHF